MKHLLPFLMIGCCFVLFAFSNPSTPSIPKISTKQLAAKDSMPEACVKEKKCCARRKRCMEKASMKDSTQSASCEKKSSGCCRSKKSLKCCKGKSK